MKNCPYCKAEIQDNARFCLYCMKPLEEKQVIEPPKKRRKIWIPIVIVLVLCLGIACVLLLSPPEKEPQSNTITPATTETGPPATTDPLTELPGDDAPSLEQPDDTPTEDEPSTEQPNDTPAEDEPSTEQPNDTPTENEPSTEQPNNVPTEDEPSTEQPNDTPMEPVPCNHSYALTDSQEATCTNQGFNVYTCKLCGNIYQQTLAASGHQYTEATCQLSKICKVCSQADGEPLGHSYSQGYCFRCNAPDYTNPKVVFSYREVGPNDYFAPDSYIPNSDIVITGVKEITPDGVYEVPAYIDEKRVVGIISLAFSETNAREVTLGENILRVNQNAFAGCCNIETLRIKSKALFLSRSALVDAAHRNCKLTIYCSADCVVDDDLYGDCYLKDIIRVYGAEYREP